MPPASLSAKPLTRPGPRTASAAASRTRPTGSRGIGGGVARGRRRRSAAPRSRADASRPAAAAPTGAPTDPAASTGVPSTGSTGGDGRGRGTPTIALPREPAREPALPARRDDRVDRVVDGHDAQKPALVVHDGDGE